MEIILKCDHFNTSKNRDQFYKNNLSKCKECIKTDSRNSKISKNDVFNMLNEIYNRINSNEIFIKEIYLYLKKIEKHIDNNIINNNLDELEHTINNIDSQNKKINTNLETIINYKNNNIIFDNEYENNLKNILED
jgi:hypothetical protein